MAATLQCNGLEGQIPPLFFLQGKLLKLVDKLHYDRGVWSIRASLTDGRNETTVVLGNRLLERLIGFSAEEFVRDMEPHKSDPVVKKRGIQVGYCRLCLVMRVS